MGFMPLKPVSRPLQPVERRRISRRPLLPRNALTNNHFPAIRNKRFGLAEFCGTVFLIGQVGRERRRARVTCERDDAIGAGEATAAGASGSQIFPPPLARKRLKRLDSLK